MSRRVLSRKQEHVQMKDTNINQPRVKLYVCVGMASVSSKCRAAECTFDRVRLLFSMSCAKRFYKLKTAKLFFRFNQ